MTMPENTSPSIHWPDLIEALRHDECVLLLGPRAATYQGEYLHDLLAERFAKMLRQKDATFVASPPYDLPLLVKQFTDQFKNYTEALEQLGKTLREFYEEFSGEEISVYRQIANLPFKYIINTAPDDLLVQNLAGGSDKKVHFFDFHFNKPEYNADMNRKAVDLNNEISEDAPLVYNLLGHYDRPDSLVLTNSDRLRFLEVVLQREKEATLPPNIAYYFLRSPLKLLRKAYIFVGFDFNEWYLRLFMHLMRRTHEHLPQSFSLQDLRRLTGDAATFYTDNFNMLFVENDPERFFQELGRQLQKPATVPSPAQMEMVLLYHPDDEAMRVEMETHLATLRHSGLVEVWHEEKILPGADTITTIRQHLNTARVIVPLVTANFLADDRLFTELLPDALQRHRNGTAKVSPILMSPCDIENTPLFELNTLYPKPKGRAVSQKPDRAETLTAIAKDLRGMIERMISFDGATQNHPVNTIDISPQTPPIQA